MKYGHKLQALWVGPPIVYKLQAVKKIICG